MNITDRTKVKRIPKRGQYDLETIYSILDAEFVCHIGFVHQGYPVVIPTLYGRKDDYLLVHGAATSRMLSELKKEVDICLTVTITDGLVLARSGFHHSANYRSVVVFGKAQLIENKAEKEAALKAVSDHIIVGRWEEVRPTKDNELKATHVFKIPIEEASAKIRTGGPADDKEDYELDVWAGVLPIKKVYQTPISDPLNKEGIEMSESVRQFMEVNQNR
ncbi:MAG: pyridoxamine 5'-phosphate oxidase family protein [Chitinophagales bacterium]